MLDEPKINEDYIYEYRDGSNFKLKGSSIEILLGGIALRLADIFLKKLGLF